jgi:sulfoquinovosidase
VRRVRSPKYGLTVPTDQLDPLVPGRLTIRKHAASSARLGEFTVNVLRSGDRGPRVRVTDGKDRVAWASDPRRSFVVASSNQVHWIWRSTAGAFWPQVERTSRLTDQTITFVGRSHNALTISGTVRGGGDSAPFTLELRQVRRSSDVNALRLDLRVSQAESGSVPDSVQLTSGRAARAAVHGLGEQYRPFNLSGQVMPILVQEQGVTRGEQPAARIVDLATWGAGNLKTTYAPWPTYVTGQKRSFELVDDLRSGAFGIADMTRKTQVSLESFRSRMRARVLARNTPKALMAARAAGFSRPELAGWIQRGAVLGIQGGTQKVRDVVAQMRTAGTKISGVWLQDWVGKRVTSFGEQLWWTWQLDRSTYPGWESMVSDFKKQGINVLTYINPFVIDADEVNGHPITNYYKQAQRKGFLVRNHLGTTYVIETVGFPTALVDLTNPKARDWFAGIIARNVIGVGATGFMADFGEYLPFDSVLHKGTGMTQHNRYPQLWSKTVREGCRRSAVPDCVAFFRSGYLCTAKDAPLMWAGDQMVNYAVQDGMQSAVKGMLAGGVSGAPLWHSDIGGYTSVNTGVTNFLRPPQLNARWAEMQAFGVVMRTHETNRPTRNQQVYSTPETRAEFARASRIYAALRDYRAGVVKEAERRGIPAMRHPWLVHPGSLVAKQDLQFFLGDHLYVAPVSQEGATSVAVTFPPGKWEHILTGQVFSGNRVTTVDAPVGTPAAFVHVGDPEGRKILTAIKAAGLRQ